jgi:hypothetical protein
MSRHRNKQIDDDDFDDYDDYDDYDGYVKPAVVVQKPKKKKKNATEKAAAAAALLAPPAPPGLAATASGVKPPAPDVSKLSISGPKAAKPSVVVPPAPEHALTGTHWLSGLSDEEEGEGGGGGHAKRAAAAAAATADAAPGLPCLSIIIAGHVDAGECCIYNIVRLLLLFYKNCYYILYLLYIIISYIYSPHSNSIISFNGRVCIF